MRYVIDLLARFWWLLLIRGILAIVFGICAFAWPGLTLSTLVMLFAAYSFVDGVFGIVHALGHRDEVEHWGLLLIEGLLGIVFGVLAFRAPELTTAVGGIIVAMYIAAWALVTGALRITMAVRLRKEIEGEWLLGISGALSVLFGILVMARPAVGVMAAIFFVGTWALLTGITLVALALQTRRFTGHLQAAAAEASKS
ncbi:MAG: HdeD family acid-resistance protein [Planctomycetaceae bacterium]